MGTLGCRVELTAIGIVAGVVGAILEALLELCLGYAMPILSLPSRGLVGGTQEHSLAAKPQRN